MLGNDAMTIRQQRGRPPDGSPQVKTVAGSRRANSPNGTILARRRIMSNLWRISRRRRDGVDSKTEIWPATSPKGSRATQRHHSLVADNPRLYKRLDNVINQNGGWPCALKSIDIGD
jgi:hypothetical protein